MKKVLYTLAALSFVFVACNKQEIVPEEGASQEGELTTVTIKASNGDADTKAAISDALAFTWTTGDKIAVHTDAGRFYESDALTTGGSNSADFTVSLSGTRDGYAVYPASVAKAWDGSTLTLTLPSEYTYAQVSGDNTPLPMIATNSGALSFYHVAGLFRVTVKAIPSDATGLVFQFPGNKVNGDFTISSPTAGTSTIITSAPAGNQDKITVTFDAGTATEMTLNIPLPTGAYEDVYITPVSSDTKVAAARHIAAGGYTAARAHGKKLTTTLVSFSVSDTKKVIFAPGNLVATITAVDGEGTPTTVTWSFHEHQYDRIMKVNHTYQSYELNDSFDLFGWATSGYNNKNPWMTTTDNSQYGPDITTGNWTSNSDDWDWGKYNNIYPYGENIWRTLTGGDNEVRYLNLLRADAADKIGFATVCGVKGLILLPDIFSDPKKNNGSGDFVPYATSGYDANIYSLGENWNAMEEAGAVFLPITGYLANGYSYAVASSGYYWTSTVKNSSSTHANTLTFGDNFATELSYPVERNRGCAVRLVRDLN